MEVATAALESQEGGPLFKWLHSKANLERKTGTHQAGQWGKVLETKSTAHAKAGRHDHAGSVLKQDTDMIGCVRQPWSCVQRGLQGRGHPKARRPVRIVWVRNLALE